jgi:hypothetical protein
MDYWRYEGEDKEVLISQETPDGPIRVSIESPWGIEAVDVPVKNIRLLSAALNHLFPPEPPKPTYVEHHNFIIEKYEDGREKFVCSTGDDEWRKRLVDMLNRAGEGEP